MKITSHYKSVTHCALAALVGILAVAPTAQAARAKKKPAPAPVVVKPVSPYSLEMALDFNSAMNDIYEEIGKINTVGASFTGVYKKDEHNSFNLRLAFGLGSGETADKFEEWDLSHVNLMPGYRYTTPLNDKTSFFIGANLGPVLQNVKYTVNYDDGSESTSNSTIGLGYSAEIGITHKCTDNTAFIAAYQFFGSTNKTELEDTVITTKQQMYNTFRVGLIVNF